MHDQAHGCRAGICRAPAKSSEATTAHSGGLAGLQTAAGVVERQSDGVLQPGNKREYTVTYVNTILKILITEFSLILFLKVNREL